MASKSPVAAVVLASLSLAVTPAWGFEAPEYYAATCAACHGVTGGGDGPVAASLDPRPSDFSDPSFWSTRDDATVATAIRDGGAAVGKSPLMAAFGATLDTSELDSLVGYLQTFEGGSETLEAEPEPEPHAATTGTGSASEPDRPVAAGPTVVGGRPEPDLGRGQVLFRQACATCHGIQGDGKGPAARFMAPRPRDLTAGVFRFRSTPMGEPALAEDLYRTIERGLRGTPMPGYSGMDADDLWHVVHYVQSLSRAPTASAPRVVPVPAPPPATPTTLARGAEVYTTAGCVACHGERGRGEGSAAAGMTDTGGHRLRPADLTNPRTFKRGEDAISLYRTISTGLDGTPMAGFETIAADDRWALVHWILDH